MQRNLFNTPDGWTAIMRGVEHPNGGTQYDLIKSRETGAYAVWDGVTVRSCPQDWARALDPGTEAAS